MPQYEDMEMANALLGNDHFRTIEAKSRAREARDKQLSLDKAMQSLLSVTGLESNEFLFQFYQKKFTELGGGNYEFEQDKLKAYTALMGLCMSKFLNVDLPIPERLRHSLLENTYSLGGEIAPWKDYYFDLSGAEKEYSDFIGKWNDSKSGRKDYQYNSYTGKKEEIYFDPDYSLRLELGQEFSKLFLDRLKELLSLDKKASTLQILKRNVDLKDFVSEANSYPGELSSIMHVELKDECEKLKGDDPLSKLCASSIMGALYGSNFDIDVFQDQVVQILWQELVDSQKSDSQKDMVEIIRRQISGEVYEGILETEVV